MFLDIPKKEEKIWPNIITPDNKNIIGQKKIWWEMYKSKDLDHF